MDSETLTFLLRGGHLNMEERKAKGIWPHPPLRFGDLVRHLAEVLAQEKWFPFEPAPHAEDELVYEGVLVEREEAHRFVCHLQRAHPLFPRQLAEQTTKVFTKPEDAAAFYLRWNLFLPGDLDSWKVVE